MITQVHEIDTADIHGNVVVGAWVEEYLDDLYIIEYTFHRLSPDTPIYMGRGWIFIKSRVYSR